MSHLQQELYTLQLTSLLKHIFIKISLLFVSVGNLEELHRYKEAVIILAVVLVLVLLVAVFVGYTFYKKLNNRRADEGRAGNAT